jgi:hypothetical protein
VPQGGVDIRLVVRRHRRRPNCLIFPFPQGVRDMGVMVIRFHEAMVILQSHEGPKKGKRYKQRSDFHPGLEIMSFEKQKLRSKDERNKCDL